MVGKKTDRKITEMVDAGFLVAEGPVAAPWLKTFSHKPDLKKGSLS